MSILDKATSGPLDEPPRICLSGVEGIGKSSFAADAPNPFFIDPERGTHHLDVRRLDVDDWLDVFLAIEDLATTDHKHETLVLDTIDGLEILNHAYVCKLEKAATLEHIGGGFGKGYSRALDEWRRLWFFIERLRAVKGMMVIMIAHTHVKKFANPDGDDYDRFQLKLHDKAANFLKEQCDVVGFAQYETVMHKPTTKSRVEKPIYTGTRIVHTTRSAAFDAKQRVPMPSEVPLNFKEFMDAYNGGQTKSPARLQAEICVLAEQFDDDYVIPEEVAGSQDAVRLAKYLDQMRGHLYKQQKETP